MGIGRPAAAFLAGRQPLINASRKARRCGAQGREEVDGPGWLAREEVHDIVHEGRFG
jgi:hypothetical protein